MSTLTVALIVKNEELFIEKVIRNIKPVADEIVITDTGSTDKTIDIIKKFKVKLFHYSWDNDESKARNFTLSNCKTDWIFFIDADEFIDKRDYQKIRNLISRGKKYIAYTILCRQYLNTRVNLDNIYQKDWGNFYNVFCILRIFKNSKGIYYSRPLYTSVADSLRNRLDKVGNSEVILHHLDILRNRQKQAEKSRWHYNSVSENLIRHPNDPDTNYSAGHYYMLRGEFNKAVKYYKKALKLKPGHISADFSLGLSYVMLGKDSQGMKRLKSCAKRKNVFPWERESYFNTAYSIIAARSLDKDKGYLNG